MVAHENLYDSLSYNITNDDLNIEEKEYLIDSISTLTQEKKELIYLLMLHDYKKYNPNSKVILPYKSKQLNNDKIEIKLDSLPLRLKRIIYKFCKLAEISDSEISLKTPSSN